MAAGSDSESLLGVLCDAAREIGGANGAAVARLAGSDGVVVCHVRLSMHRTRVRTFDVSDSLAGNALRSRSLIVEHDDPSLACPIFAPDAHVGEVAVAPLIAGGSTGRSVVRVASRRWRHHSRGAIDSACERIADHAAVVLVKARLLEEAQAATHAKGAFLATISHELRTPLTALTGYGELLADEILGPLSAHQLDMVDRMRSVTHQLGVMVDELLTFSALEAGREIGSSRARSRLADIVESVVGLSSIRWRARRTSCSRLRCPNVSPMLFTDGDKVRQILVNLMGNAVKFTDTGRVDVGVSRRDGEVCVNVRDTGIGIR